MISVHPVRRLGLGMLWFIRCSAVDFVDESEFYLENFVHIDALCRCMTLKHSSLKTASGRMANQQLIQYILSCNVQIPERIYLCRINLPSKEPRTCVQANKNFYEKKNQINKLFWKSSLIHTATRGIRVAIVRVNVDSSSGSDLQASLNNV